MIDAIADGQVAEDDQRGDLNHVDGHVDGRRCARALAGDPGHEEREDLGQLFRASGGSAPVDGYFSTFWRILLRYPEILSWESLWTDSFQGAQAELYGLAKAIAPQKPFGFHLMQSMTFSPFYRAEEDYT